MMAQINPQAMGPNIPVLGNPPANGIALPNYQINIVDLETKKKHNRIGYMIRRVKHLFKDDHIDNPVNYPIQQNELIDTSNRFNSLEDQIDEIYINDAVQNDPGLVTENIQECKQNLIEIKTNNASLKLSWKDYIRIKDVARINKHAKVIDDDILRKQLIDMGYSISDIDDCLQLDRNDEFEDARGGFDIGCETNQTNNQETQSNLLDTKQFKFSIKSKVNEIANKLKSIEAWPKLVYFLKTKYFMAHRSINLINNMIRDARIYMLNNKYECDNEDDYYILTQSVMAAYSVDDQELKFRKIIKKDHFNAVDLNEILEGKIKSTILSPFHLKEISKGVRGKFQHETVLPSKQVNI